MSSTSPSIEITYHERPDPVLGGPPQTWLTEGDSATLTCEVKGFTTGWRFHWYKTAPYRPGLIHVIHKIRADSLELLSDSIRGAGGSYTLSPAALRHTGVYVCRAERGEPAHHTEFSQPQPLWVTGLSSPASLVVHPDRNQHFTYQFLSLSCEGNGNSTGLKLRWFSKMMERESCPFKWISEAGSSCSIRSLLQSHSGVYWCQSESGEQSNPVNITIQDGIVILESPVHPVTEGDPLTLRCRYRYQPSNVSADFYKDGTLLQTSTTGEITIPAVSQSHEGLYKCSNPESGESPKSWITVKEKPKPVLRGPPQTWLTDGDVTLESPVHPVTEGDPLTLCCRYRSKPSHISADFYKDGTLLQTSTTGEMTIPAVSKSHEGLYKCSNPESGESPESWITVKVSAPHSGLFLLLIVGLVVGLVILFGFLIILLVIHRFKKGNGLGTQTTQSSVTTSSGQQQEITKHGSTQDQSQSTGSDWAQSECIPLQTGNEERYGDIPSPNHEVQARVELLRQILTGV
ncbi:Fc receptor-like protein 5 [Sardina pilchardus]|uniref:Fc receptor-like protein 5 n=1 Tax=Sardina pilchardus TaxID=27697 RepID=UPI002E1136A8